MAYTLEQVRKMVMDLVGEDSANPTYWTGSAVDELDEWILDAVEEICLVTGGHTEELRLPLGSGKKYYWLDPGKESSLLWIKHLRIEPAGKRLNLKDPVALSRDDFNWMTRTGTPEVWFPIGLEGIRVVPFPTTGGQMLEATIVTVPRLPDENDEDIPLEDSLVAGVTAYATATTLIQQRRLDKVQGWLLDYAKAIGLGKDHSFNMIGRAFQPKALGHAGFGVTNPS